MRLFNVVLLPPTCLDADCCMTAFALLEYTFNN
jgi:hypothetical protein